MTRPDGIDAMRERIARRTRRPPRARRPQSQGGVRDRVPAASGGDRLERADATTEEPTPAAVSGANRTGGHEAHPSLSPTDASANLAVRVRRPLDERLADLVYGLRRGGVRSSKVELVEMLLYELPPTATPELRKRLSRFRRHAPRGPAAPLGE
jgi:hypothetical protein